MFDMPREQLPQYPTRNPHRSEGGLGEDRDSVDGWTLHSISLTDLGMILIMGRFECCFLQP
jgi:hypothetical protein